MNNIEKDVLTEQEIKEKNYNNIIKDVIAEIDDRANNLKVYFPYFIITRKLKAESENFGFDLAQELKASEYLKTKEGEKDLLAVIVSGDKEKVGTDTIKVRRV